MTDTVETDGWSYVKDHRKWIIEDLEGSMEEELKAVRQRLQAALAESLDQKAELAWLRMKVKEAATSLDKLSAENPPPTPGACF